MSPCEAVFDENLSRKLIVRLSELYPGSVHVSEVDLLERPDRDIWDFAETNGFIIVTTDADFYELAAAKGPPLKSYGCGDGDIRRGTLNLYSGGTPYGSRNSPAIRLLVFWCWTASKPAVFDRDRSTADFRGPFCQCAHPFVRVADNTPGGDQALPERRYMGVSAVPDFVARSAANRACRMQCAPLQRSCRRRRRDISRLFEVQ